MVIVYIKKYFPITITCACKKYKSKWCCTIFHYLGEQLFSISVPIDEKLDGIRSEFFVNCPNQVYFCINSVDV